MEKSTKIGIAIGVVVLLAGGGIALAASLNKKDETVPGTGGTGNPLDNTGTTGSSSETEPAASSGDTDGNIIPPSGGGSTYTPPTTYTPPIPAPAPTTPNTTVSDPIPTAEEYIRMADRWMTWENIYKFADKLAGITNKKEIGGVAGAYPDAIISNTSRRKFGEIRDKFPNWKTLFMKKADELGIPYSKANYDAAQKYMKDTYGFEMAEFAGNRQPNKFSWR